MPNIRPLTLDELTPEMRERMEASCERSGYYPNAQLTLARRPEVAKAVQNLQQSIGGSSTVPMQTMFMVAELTSKIAGCRHCQSHVAKNLSRHGVDANKIRAIWEYQTSDLFDERERAALDLAFAAAQRPSMAGPEQFDRLREVGYVIEAHVKLTGKAPEDTVSKHESMFRRRAKRGQCFHRPCLGTREFAADFELAAGAVPSKLPASQRDRDLGWMLHDLDYSADPPTPRFFRAQMCDGVIEVPSLDSEEVRT